MSKEEEKERERDLPKAYISLSGQILECNQDFLSITGLNERDIPHTSLTSLAKYKDPQSMLESAYQLDQLADAKSGSEWHAELGVGKEIKNDDYQIIAKVSDKKLNGQTVLEATVLFNEAAAQAKSLPKYSKKQSEEINDFTPQRVLLVEDSPTSLKLMVRTVERLGHIITTAVDGADALEKFRTDNFDIVLMDINMPNMNGLEAANEMRIDERHKSHKGKAYVKIIAMSADISNTLFHEVTNAGFDTFVPKPLTVESFKDVMKLPTRHF